MNKYELLYVLTPLLGEEGLSEMNARIRQQIEDAASNVEVEDMGMKQLAYEIADQKEAYYVVVTFEADAEFPKELERVLRINDKVLRFLIVRPEA